MGNTQNQLQTETDSLEISKVETVQGMPDFTIVQSKQEFTLPNGKKFRTISRQLLYDCDNDKITE
jgi:hypothetical protein